jgi:hypothetical protein
MNCGPGSFQPVLGRPPWTAILGTRQDVDAAHGTVSAVKKSQANVVLNCARRNSRQTGPGPSRRRLEATAIS